MPLTYNGPYAEIRADGEHAKIHTPECREWARAWQKYVKEADVWRIRLKTKFEEDGVVIWSSEYAQVFKPVGEHVKTLALYDSLFGFDRRWLLQNDQFFTPGWWWVAMDPTHQRMSGLSFPYKPKKVK